MFNFILGTADTAVRNTWIKNDILWHMQSVSGFFLKVRSLQE